VTIKSIGKQDRDVGKTKDKFAGGCQNFSGGQSMEQKAQIEFVHKLSAAVDLPQPLPYELFHPHSETGSTVTKDGEDNAFTKAQSYSGNDFGVGLPPLAKSRCL
jgi:hypothetical protein